jgi:hypothetical protein
VIADIDEDVLLLKKNYEAKGFKVLIEMDELVITSPAGNVKRLSFDLIKKMFGAISVEPT